MYFNNNQSNTNIDKEFKQVKSKKQLSSSKINLGKYKTFIIIGVILVLLLVMILFFVNKKVTNTIILNGENIITLYQGTDYIEPGYEAYNSKEENLTSQVHIESNLNTDIIGQYEIKYTIGEVTKTRIVNVIEKSKEYTYIYLNQVNNNVNVYLKLGEQYTEPGYQVFNSAGHNLTNQVTIAGSVDSNKKGNYQLTYSVTDTNGVVVTATRTVIVMDSEINLTLDKNNYTNGQVTINAKVIDEYFDYMILPNNEQVSSNTYSYKVSDNGTYTFTVYNKKGMSKQTSITVKNIDKTSPKGSCTIDENTSGSIIQISASDTSGIQKYSYNNQNYTSNRIELSTFINQATITIYDNANNTKAINCTVVPKVYINNIQQDGVIVTINARKVNNEIAGYYFSYTNQRPDKNSGGYISTNKDNIDVVRLPGTTYVWVEDTSGKISEPKTVTLTNDVLLITSGKNYKVLENQKLSTYLSNNGWSIEGLNQLIARSVRAAGLYTKTAAATSAVAFQTVLAQKYKIKLPYWNGGKSYDFGADPTWGQYKKHYAEQLDVWYYYYGLDCSGFTTWAYVNAGYNVKNTPNVGIYPSYFWYKWTSKSITFSKENGEIGDFIANSGHVKLIIGKTPTAFITAEAAGKTEGMMVSLHNYNNPGNYKIQKGELLMQDYNKYDKSEIPTGF